MNKDDVLNEIIKGYRYMITKRYTFERLNSIYDLPNTINENIVLEIKGFFLNYIYPDIDRRKELNEAFNTLDANIKNPEKLFGILTESVKLLFTHGHHLPKIMGAGLKALKSYRAGTRFENSLVNVALKLNLEPAYDVDKINKLIVTLPRFEIDEFINSPESLFQIMYNKTLIAKIKAMLSYLIERMKRRTGLFSTNETKGLEIGLEMLTKGEMVLNKLSESDQDILIRFIIQVETDNLDELFSK